MRPAAWESILSSVCIGGALSDQGCELWDAFSFSPTQELISPSPEWALNAIWPLLPQRSYWHYSCDREKSLWFAELGSRAGVFYLKVATWFTVLLRIWFTESWDRLFTSWDLLELLPNALPGSRWQLVTQWTFYYRGLVFHCISRELLTWKWQETLLTAA